MSSNEITATELKDKLAATVERVARGGARLRVTRHGRAQAAIVSVEDLELLERIERESDLRAAARVRKKGAKARPLDDVLRDLGL